MMESGKIDPGSRIWISQICKFVTQNVIDCSLSAGFQNKTSPKHLINIHSQSQLFQLHFNAYNKNVVAVARGQH